MSSENGAFLQPECPVMPTIGTDYLQQTINAQRYTPGREIRPARRQHAALGTPRLPLLVAATRFTHPRKQGTSLIDLHGKTDLLIARPPPILSTLPSFIITLVT